MMIRVLTVVILLLLLLAVGVLFLDWPLRESDKEEAARNLVAWIVDGRSVFGEEYPDAKRMLEMKRFFVVCDFLPPGVPLSGDPRVQRISAKEDEAIFKKHRFDDTTYIVIKLQAESRTQIVLDFSNTFNSLAAHGYQFELRRKIWGLRASGKLLWVS